MTFLDDAIHVLSPRPGEHVPADGSVWARSVVADQAVWNEIDSAPAPDLPELRQPWRHGWRSNEQELTRLYHAVRTFKPNTIIETGTLAGHATLAFAAGLRDADMPGSIYTIDYDGDPVQDAKNDGKITKEDWATLRSNRSANLETVRAVAPRVTVEFIEGDSRKVLPALLKRVPRWDFWFQDSMHFKSGIQEELDILAPHAADDAVVVFDNVDRVHPFGRWYTGRIKGKAAYRSLTEGRSRQLWTHAKGGLPHS